MRVIITTLLVLAFACSTPPEEPLTLSPPGIDTRAEGAQWTSTVIVDHGADSTSYTYEVRRWGAIHFRDETFTGTTTVPAGQTAKLDFPLDPEGNLLGYRLVLNGDGTFLGTVLLVGPTADG